ncbi:hypothetical protein COJ30_01665 [Bacillus anthracis]|uniref:Uncharacterized protein n=1 Tax=Bacillus anthracis TaxID=1392 RepID=A0A2B0YFE5_BACAN|nr:hypothetical protein COJ30_01665 [Bacillus anthracis]
MFLTLVFFPVPFIFYVSTYIGFFLWKHFKVVVYIPDLVGFIITLVFVALLQSKSVMN